YRFIGCEIAVNSTVVTNGGIVLLGDITSAQNTLARIPHHLILDRCYVHGNTTHDCTRGVAMNCAYGAVIDSYVSECHIVGQDSQAIWGCNGPGPFVIQNNHLEGAAENIMFGGADPAVANLIPSDIVIRRNHLIKPLSWRVGDPSYAGIHWSVKNLLEIKLGNRVLIEGNVMENSWLDGQNGYAMIIWSVNQSGAAPWSITQDVWIRKNLVRHASSSLQLIQFGSDIQ